MATANKIMELSAMIARETAVVNNYLVQNNLPTPSLDVDAPWDIPIPEDAQDVEASRQKVLTACAELNALMTGPKTLLHFQWTAYASTKAILRFKLDKSFAVGDSTSFEAMAEFSGLSVRNVRRIVRHAIINHHIFQENTPGVITHSAPSAILANDEIMRNSLVLELDEFWPSAVKLADAMEKWPNSENSNETGFSLANNSNMNMFDIFAKSPERADRFIMYFLRDMEPANVILDNYPWASKGTVVDVGGSLGSVAINIAERFPSINCIVQDLPDVVAKGQERLPVNLQGRVTFMAHDFFTKQPVTADVYYFRSIFHNWGDTYCLQILQNLIPALERGASIVISERILPGLETLSTVDAQRAINMDVGMLQLLNAHQREIHEWPELFRRADPRFQYVGAYQPSGGIRWIIEAKWKG